MALRFAWRRTFLLGSSFVLLSGLGMACGGDSTDDDVIGGGLTSGTTPRKPGGGPSSGGTFDSSSSGRTGSSSSSSSSSGGETSSSSSSGSETSSSSSGEASSSSGEPACSDPTDAPDSQDDAPYLPIIANGTTHDEPGILDGELDVDWYAYSITGSPTTVLSLGEAVPAELCIFTSCASGTLTQQCNSGSVADTDEYGTPGCCATGTATTPASLTTYMYCSPGADDSYVNVRITSLADQCADYTAHFKF